MPRTGRAAAAFRANPTGATILAIILLAAAAKLIVHSVTLFDDAFISYRYARHLAEGLGLVWNPGERTEGYTNFLLVLVLAPFIRLGLDPLAVARGLNLMALTGMALVLHRHCRWRYGASPWVAAVAIAPFVLMANSIRISMAGIETIPFAFFLLCGLVLLVRHGVTGSVRALSLSFLCQLAACLLRPEGVLLTAVTGAYLAFRAIGRIREGERPEVAPFAAALWFIVPLAAYLAWKYLYFGHLLPNPYYLKVADSPAMEFRGLGAVVRYGTQNAFLIGLVLLSTLLYGTRYRVEFALGLLFVATHAVFYARVDPLMDLGSRFLYPVTPILFLTALPVLLEGYRALERVSGSAPLKAAIALSAIYFLVPTAGRDAVRAAAAIRDGPDRSGYAIVYKRYEVGRALADYEEIENVTIALGDAGVIPWLVPARVVDIVGLNDRFIATTSDYDALVQYLFSAGIDLMFHATSRDLTPITWGHGRLGKMDRWVANPHARWEDYEYVGTQELPRGGHEFHLLLRRGYPRFQEFRRFLEHRVVDRYDERFVAPGRVGPAGPPNEP